MYYPDAWSLGAALYGILDLAFYDGQKNKIREVFFGFAEYASDVPQLMGQRPDDQRYDLEA